MCEHAGLNLYTDWTASGVVIVMATEPWQGVTISEEKGESEKKSVLVCVQRKTNI